MIAFAERDSNIRILGHVDVSILEIAQEYAGITECQLSGHLNYPKYRDVCLAEFRVADADGKFNTPGGTTKISSREF